MNKSISYLAALAAAVSSAAGAAPQPTHTGQTSLAAEAPKPSASVWSIDYMTIKPGLLDDYLTLLSGTWANTRQHLKSEGKLRSYRVIVADADPSVATREVMLITEYPNEASYAAREEMFAPVMAAMGTRSVRVNGRNGADMIESRRFATARSFFGL